MKTITKRMCSKCKKRKATTFFHTKPLCNECYYKLKYPKKRSITMNQLLELQNEIKNEYKEKEKQLSK